MRYWIEYIMNNNQAYEDFIADLLERERTLDKEIASLLRDGKTAEATNIAHESRVYENMRKKFQAEFNERKSTATYNQQFNEGGN